MIQGTVSAGLVNGMIAYACAHGASRDTLLGRAGLSAANLADADNRIALDNYQTLIHAAQDICNDPAIALKWAEQVDMAEVSIVGLIMNASRTMGEAFAQMQRYTSLALEIDVNTPGPRFVLEQKGDGLWMVDRRREPNTFPEIAEMSFARLVCGPRRFLERPHVLEVHFTHMEPSYTDEYDRIFHCPVAFSSEWNALKLHPDIASWPVQLEPGYVFGILTRHADQLLEDMNRSSTLKSKVESALMPVLHKGDFTAETIAEALGFSRQTLYRKLHAEGTSFGEIVDGLRNKLAHEYLKGKKTSVNETAYLLGYSDPAAFSRAFKRWTGRSPRDVASL